MNGWTSKDSLELYGVPEWGADLFSINEKGNISVQPQGSDGSPDRPDGNREES